MDWSARSTAVPPVVCRCRWPVRARAGAAYTEGQETSLWDTSHGKRLPPHHRRAPRGHGLLAAGRATTEREPDLRDDWRTAPAGFGGRLSPHRPQPGTTDARLHVQRLPGQADLTPAPPARDGRQPQAVRVYPTGPRHPRRLRAARPL